MKVSVTFPTVMIRRDIRVRGILEEICNEFRRALESYRLTCRSRFLLLSRC